MKTVEEQVEEIRQMYRAEGKILEEALKTTSTPQGENSNGQVIEVSEAVYHGFATYYDGKTTASGAKFDSHAMTAAMTKEKVPVFGTKVIVEYTPKHGSGTNSICVEVNDRGPFERGPDEKALKPYRPDPDIIIDLTLAAFEKLVGSKKLGKVHVAVKVPK